MSDRRDIHDIPRGLGLDVKTNVIDIEGLYLVVQTGGPVSYTHLTLPTIYSV